MKVRKEILIVSENKTKRRKEIKKSSKFLVFSLLIGAFIGLINGFFGGGGGMICVPFFESFLGLEKKKAHATAISVILPISLASSFVYVFEGMISSNILILVAIGVVFGGVFGAILLKFLPTKIIAYIFAVLMIISGVKLII